MIHSMKHDRRVCHPRVASTTQCGKRAPKRVTIRSSIASACLLTVMAGPGVATAETTRMEISPETFHFNECATVEARQGVDDAYRCASRTGHDLILEIGHGMPTLSFEPYATQGDYDRDGGSQRGAFQRHHMGGFEGPYWRPVDDPSMEGGNRELVVEWVEAVRGDERTPVAVIYRSRRRSYQDTELVIRDLHVVRFGEDGSCVIGRIAEAYPQHNVGARLMAEHLAPGFDCATDSKIFVLGSGPDERFMAVLAGAEGEGVEELREGIERGRRDR